MKRLFTVTSICLVLAASGQTEKGKWIVGANVNLSFSSTSIDGESESQSSFALAGQAGYFIIENLAAGLSLGLRSTKQGFETTPSTSIGPFARYYINGKFYFGSGFTFTRARTKLGSTVTSEDSGGTLLLEAGYPFWLVENIALEPGLTYVTGTGDLSDRSTFSFGVGFRLYF